jgi:hypothetical protein
MQSSRGKATGLHPEQGCMRRILPHPLWIGHVGDLGDPASIRAAGIKALVDLAIDELPSVPGREWLYCRFPLLDGAGNPPWLVQAAVRTVAGLLRARTPTMVYCSGGMSRSPCIAAAGLAVAKGAPAAACLAEVIHGGPADVSGLLWEALQAAIRRETACRPGSA